MRKLFKWFLGLFGSKNKQPQVRSMEIKRKEPSKSMKQLSARRSKVNKGRQNPTPKALKKRRKLAKMGKQSRKINYKKAKK